MQCWPKKILMMMQKHKGRLVHDLIRKGLTLKPIKTIHILTFKGLNITPSTMIVCCLRFNEHTIWFTVWLAFSMPYDLLYEFSQEFSLRFCSLQKFDSGGQQWIFKIKIPQFTISIYRFSAFSVFTFSFRFLDFYFKSSFQFRITLYFTFEVFFWFM